jgi:hypothetical protein
MEVSGQLHAPVTLLLEEESPICIRQEIACAPELIRTLRTREEFLPLPRINSDSIIIQPAAY